MVNLKKVVKIGSTKTTNPNKEDQKKYEEKVKNMQAACENFKKEFKEYLYIPNKWQGLLKENFEGQMAKNRLVSRTSRILHDMSNKLSKFKEKSFDPKKVKEYKKAFKFTAKKANSKDYIKRSAIDDKEVANFFNNQIGSILEIGKKAIMEFDPVIVEQRIAEADKLIKYMENIENDKEAKKRFINDLIKYFN